MKTQEFSGNSPKIRIFILAASEGRLPAINGAISIDPIYYNECIRPSY